MSRSSYGVSAICVCVTIVDQKWIRHLSLLPFDPELIYWGSLDRLVAIVSDLGFSVLCRDDDGGILLQHYREVYGHFKHRWASGMPVADDVLTMWLCYPHWNRCQKTIERG